jgi:quercetin dioxygenase-like cupin family protein
MANPIVNIGCVSNVFVRMMHFVAAGDSENGHTHPFDHITLLAKGKIKVVVGNAETEFTAPHMIFIKAEQIHRLEALTDGAVAYCIHALREQGASDIIDPAMVPTGSKLTALMHSLVNA